MVIKWGRNGHFLACSGYPECRNTKEYVKNADGTLTIRPTTRPSDMKCPTCGADMVIRRGRFGEFQACTRYPDCKTTAPMSLGVNCPKPGCGGYLTEKRSKRGKVFFGCSNYQRTNCDFVSWDRPVPQACPKCSLPFLLQKVSKTGTRLYCNDKEGCGYTMDAGEAGEETPPSEGGDAGGAPPKTAA
jgi:DNA topoisomerase-1